MIGDALKFRDPKSEVEVLHRLHGRAFKQVIFRRDNHSAATIFAQTKPANQDAILEWLKSQNLLGKLNANES